MSAPRKIRIEDLREPVLTDIQKAALAHGEDNPVELSLKAVEAAAIERTGLEDFGPEDYRERLGLWLSEVDGDAERTAIGRFGVFNDCVRNAASRLLIFDLLKRHPEIHDQQIERPIIVIGLPRSGTTHLVNLIAADQRLRSMPLWEGQEPVPNPKDVPGEDGGDPRWARSEAAWQGMKLASPLIASMHPMNPDHIHEELELQLPDFTSYNQEWVARSPKWRDYYLAHDQTPHYEWLRTMLEVLQWYKPRERWVLKCPQHLEQIGPLTKTFPDATIVVTHRDPVSVIQSAITMLTYGARMNYTNPRPEFYLEYWTDRIERLLRASVRDRGLLPSDRTVDVLFHELMADDMGTVERIYETAGLEMTDAARAQIKQYVDDHPRGKEGQVVYDLRADFDAEPADVRSGFDFYLDEFDIRQEVR
ncbi:MAG: sulfotransferase [Myxococcota bacterium]|nr:sulfotransferase [Myxococcota bacterium]